MRGEKTVLEYSGMISEEFGEDGQSLFGQIQEGHDKVSNSVSYLMCIKVQAQMQSRTLLPLYLTL